jgi:hypothetical protein
MDLIKRLNSCPPHKGEEGWCGSHVGSHSTRIIVLKSHIGNIRRRSTISGLQSDRIQRLALLGGVIFVFKILPTCGIVDIHPLPYYYNGKLGLLKLRMPGISALPSYPLG